MNFISPERLAFVDLLRGLAAFGVAIGHLVMLFLLYPAVVANITMAEPIPPLSIPSAFVKAYEIVDFASVGVAAFFIISGFVIPLSLEGASVRAYLLKRVIRIFPTYWIALAIGIAALFVSAAYWSKPVVHTWIDYFANVFFVADFFARFDIPSVMWTLQVEMKFYLLAPFFYATLSKGSYARALLWGAGILVSYWFAATGCGKGAEECWSHYRFDFRMVSREGMFISYMLIGSIFYAHYRRLITNRQAVFGVTFLFACFLLSLPFSSFPTLASLYPLPYLLGLAIFSLCYLYRDRIALKRPFRFLADISYPLYVVHPLVGYVTMRLLIVSGLPYPLALLAALALIFATAFAIHVYVEAPSIALGKRFAALVELGVERRGPRPHEEPEAVFAQTAREPHKAPIN